MMGVYGEPGVGVKTGGKDHAICASMVLCVKRDSEWTTVTSSRLVLMPPPTNLSSSCFVKLACSQSMASSLWGSSEHK